MPIVSKSEPHRLTACYLLLSTRAFVLLVLIKYLPTYCMQLRVTGPSRSSFRSVYST